MTVRWLTGAMRTEWRKLRAQGLTLGEIAKKYDWEYDRGYIRKHVHDVVFTKPPIRRGTQRAFVLEMVKKGWSNARIAGRLGKRSKDVASIKSDLRGLGLL